MTSEYYKLDILVASNIGTFKHVEYTSNSKDKQKIHQLQKIKELEKQQGITCMTWAGDDQTQLLIGRKNRTIQTFDLTTKQFTKTLNVDVKEGTLHSVSTHGENVIAGISTGIIKIWKSKTSEESIIDTAGAMDKMRHSAYDSNIIASGGKENDLKLWNIETGKMTYQAKNVPHDWLQLRVPIWVSDICFLPEGDGKVIGVCSRYGVVRLYDTRAQRRPVCSVEFNDQAGSCISNGHRERHVIVGTGRGLLNLVDLRMKGKLDKSYKGAVGAITDVTCCKERNVIISTSLDRHLRIHDSETKKMVYNEYLTSKLTCFLLRKVAKPIKIEEYEETIKEEDFEKADITKDEETDEEYEDMFKNMEVIRENEILKKKKKRKKVESCINDEDDSLINEPISKKRKNTKSENSNKKIDKSNKNAEAHEIPDVEDGKSLDESIKNLLKSTEKQKRKLEKERKKKKSKSLFSK